MGQNNGANRSQMTRSSWTEDEVKSSVTAPALTGIISSLRLSVVTGRSQPSLSPSQKETRKVLLSRILHTARTGPTSTSVRTTPPP